MPSQSPATETTPRARDADSGLESPWNAFSYGVSLCLLAFLTTTGAVGSIGLLVGIPITHVHLWVALGITLLVTHYGVGQDLRRTVLVTICSTALTLFAIGLSSFFTDYGNDVYGYHTPIVLALDQGWNPVYTPRITQWDPVFASEVWLPWVDVHAKFHCVSFAVLYKYFRDTGAFEYTHLLIILVSFLTSAMALREITGINRSFRLLIAGLAALNPIALLQWQTGYIDGLLASLITILVISLSAFVFSGKTKYLVLVICAFIVGAGIKLSGPILITLLAIIVIGAAWLCGRRAYLGRAILTVAVATGISGLCLVNPMITNTLEFGSPLYPFVTFGDKKDTPPAESPYPEDTNRFQRFLWAHILGYEPGNTAQPYQIPLIHYRYLATYNHNIGGLGPLFGAFFVAGAILLCFQRKQGFLLLLALGIFATVFLQPYVERGRYIPQVWLIPVLGLLAFLSSGSGERRSMVAGAVAALAVLNTSIVFTTYLGEQRKETRTFFAGLAELKQFGGTIYRVDTKHTVATQKAVYQQLGCNFDPEPTKDKAKPIHRFANYRLGAGGQFTFSSFIAKYGDSRIVLYVDSKVAPTLPQIVLDWLESAGAEFSRLEGNGSYLALVSNGIVKKDILVNEQHTRARLDGLALDLNGSPKNHVELVLAGERLLLHDLDFHLIALPPEGMVHLSIRSETIDQPRAVTTFVPREGLFGTFLRHKILSLLGSESIDSLE